MLAEAHLRLRGWRFVNFAQDRQIGHKTSVSRQSGKTDGWRGKHEV
jgi:hypothetical protein